MTILAMHELNPTECLDLLIRTRIGRLAFIDSVGVLPMIVPVNYLVYEGSVVFRAGPGSKLAAAVRGAPVAFEVDSTDETDQTGWSVVVRGRAEEIVDAGELADLQDRQLATWAPGNKRHYVRVNASLVTGRRIDLNTADGLWWDPTP